jgi:hypothetical protein
MNAADIRQKLHHYIDTANDKKVKAIYKMVEDAKDETSDHWKDDGFVEELEKVSFGDIIPSPISNHFYFR